jgi:hypothetical protein
LDVLKPISACAVGAGIYNHQNDARRTSHKPMPAYQENGQL